MAGDFTDPRSLDRVPRGVGRAFLLTGRAGGDDDARFLRVARAAGVRHPVKVSAAAAVCVPAEDGREG